MTHWKLILAYDGTPYHGWQIQPGLPTVQSTLSGAIHRAINERVLPQGSGRTDTGVHALGQIASFTLQAPIPPDRLQLALNRCLPPSIRVLSAELVSPHFHARHSALRKTYEYRIFPLRKPLNLGCHPGYSEAPYFATAQSEETQDRVCPPTLAPFVWPCPWPLSLDLLNRATAQVVGTHDFTTFAASDPDLTTRAKSVNLIHTEPNITLAKEMAAAARTPIRTITQSEWTLRDGLFIYRVTATGFLHHMVRNLVGTFVQCGANRLDADSIPTLLAARDRSTSGPTAPPTGLFLVSVDYPPITPESNP
ncbi:MAG TPA: tRNA pseudouridine synthase A [Acidobacteriaceae bacterium]|jgi:tRNA pseudouridine38-40 synthase|nr:tRNA pseudouridine synthase A [Acidobacteriaceae bacterium]